MMDPAARRQAERGLHELMDQGWYIDWPLWAPGQAQLFQQEAEAAEAEEAAQSSCAADCRIMG
eukprot:12636824-Prorocentrum_lima.AAC.1